MESTRLWIRDHCNIDSLQSFAKDRGLDGSNVKLSMYWAAAVVVLALVTRSIVHRRKANRSWLKLRSRSPDPEKSDDINKFVNQMSPSQREFGSKSLSAYITIYSGS